MSFAAMRRSLPHRCLPIGCVLALWVWLPVALLAADPPADPQPLAGTKPLVDDGVLADQMMDGLHRFIERKIEEAAANREKLWHRDFSSPEKYAASIEGNRESLQSLIGATSDSEPPAAQQTHSPDRSPESYADLANRHRDASTIVGETDRYRVCRVRWQTDRQLTAEGLVAEPLEGQPSAGVVVVPDAGQIPEQMLGIEAGLPPASQFARRLAEAGVLVLVPALLSRDCEFSGNEEIGYTNQSHREWIFRQASQMGEHPIGYELRAVSAGIDWLSQSVVKRKIGIAGYGEGGLIALYAAACDQRIDAALVSGYFAERSRPWEEPLYRHVWSLSQEFGDAEIASLVAPRGLIIEASHGPALDGPLPAHALYKKTAAVGKLVSPDVEGVRREFERLERRAPKLQPRALIVPETEAQEPFSAAAMGRFAGMLGIELRSDSGKVIGDGLSGFGSRPRQQRLVRNAEDRVQRMIHADSLGACVSTTLISATSPFDDMNASDLRSSEKVVPRLADARKFLRDEILGHFDDAYLPLAPRSRLVYDRPKWKGYDVVLDVFPDVFAWGVLLVPKDLKPGERRPVVVCQHGRNGVPRDVIEGNHKAYHDFAARLCERGYIVFAAHAPFRGEDRYRLLNRKANLVKASLWSFILAQHEQILNWLGTLDFVDAKRIGFYGLSYGGEAAMRVPPLLDRYALSICSGDFNDWNRKVASTDSKYSFMYTIEWEMPYFNMGNTFNYAELAALMVPRPFMVERGHDDPVAPDEWVAYEYAKVRRLYDQLGIGDKTEIEFFNGGHEINGVGTFRFLDKHLNHTPKE